MTFAVVILAALVAALVALRERDARQLARVLEAAAEERRSLLDRIQHPERVQVQAIEREHRPPPTDSAEIAHIGREVPAGVQVGHGPIHEEDPDA